MHLGGVFEASTRLDRPNHWITEELHIHFRVPLKAWRNLRDAHWIRNPRWCWRVEVEATREMWTLGEYYETGQYVEQGRAQTPKITVLPATPGNLKIKEQCRKSHTIQGWILMLFRRIPDSDLRLWENIVPAMRSF